MEDVTSLCNNLLINTNARCDVVTSVSSAPEGLLMFFPGVHGKKASKQNDIPFQYQL